MNVMIIATKACTHRKNLEKELECLHIPYRVCFVEDRADSAEDDGRTPQKASFHKIRPVVRHSTTF